MIQPLETKILIKPEEIKTERNGIILPENNRQRTGIVLQVGDEVEGIKVGDRIDYVPKNLVEQEGNHLLDDYENNVLFVY